MNRRTFEAGPRLGLWMGRQHFLKQRTAEKAYLKDNRQNRRELREPNEPELPFYTMEIDKDFEMQIALVEKPPFGHLEKFNKDGKA